MKFSDQLIRAIGTVNQDVAPELYFEDESYDEKMLILAETCIDAGRISIRGFKDEYGELLQLISDHGYDAVLAETAKHVSLW